MSKVYIPGLKMELEVDFENPKRCECGVLIYLGKTGDNKVIPIHQTINGYAYHFLICQPAQKIRKKYEKSNGINSQLL